MSLLPRKQARLTRRILKRYAGDRWDCNASTPSSGIVGAGQVPRSVFQLLAERFRKEGYESWRIRVLVDAEEQARGFEFLFGTEP